MSTVKHTGAHADTTFGTKVYGACWLLTLPRGVDNVILRMSVVAAHHDLAWHGRDDNHNDGCLLIYLP